jgi:DEAD/DEAH box helicase domain-containing protein
MNGNPDALDRLFARWEKDEQFQEKISAWRKISPRTARYAPFPPDISLEIQNHLASLGIQNLYAHQVVALDELRQGNNIVMTSGTASGKSLVYQLAILNSLLKRPQTRALLIFPTKALARDQYNKLATFLDSARISGLPDLTPPAVAVYDGDTPNHTRTQIRQQAKVLITNPDMLQVGILPHHTRWAEFFSNLEWVVLDEIHIYRGVFGSHIANVLRRMKRITEFYGSSQQFILTSATIGNPAEHAERLTSLPVRLIEADDSPSGEKHFLLINPPITDPELGLRRSLAQETQMLADELYTYQLQTLIFARSRRTVELLVHGLQTLLPASKNALNVRGYRSGYLPGHRRAIEADLRSGEARLVIATNALELGIDIGGLDAVLIAGYPGNIASTRQQAGRAGRLGTSKSLVTLIFGSQPLDQFIARHEAYLFANNPEKALINPDHPVILFQHLLSAAYELPFRSDETFGGLTEVDLREILQLLVSQGKLHFARDKYIWMDESFPAADISLRNASADRVRIQSNGQTIGITELSSAYWMLHPQAIYLQEGNSYFVQSLNLETLTAEVLPVEVDYYTEPKREVEIQINQVLQSQQVIGATKFSGELTVITQITGYKKVQWGTYANLGLGVVDLPPVRFQTEGYWQVIDPETVEILRDQGLWANDRNDYGPEWKFLREIVRKRDAYRCQVCGTMESGIPHHVHHKIPFRAFTSSTEANQLSNLVTLCPACHRRAEQSVRIRSGLAGLGYALVNLAPLLLMCDLADLGAHTDPQSTLAAGSPVVVIYENIPAGIGLTRELYSRHGELVNYAQELVAGCTCEDGCPACVGPGGESGFGGKQPALALLYALCGKDPARALS